MNNGMEPMGQNGQAHGGDTGLPQEAPPKKTQRQNRANSLLEWLVALLVALIIAIVLNQVVFVNAKIPSRSMENTIHVGDMVLGFRLSYWFAQPKRGDIVIFKYPDDVSQYFVKRVIGLPGEEVLIEAGLVYINGLLYSDDNNHAIGTLRGDFGPYQVPEDAYFVMGDNRNDSWDSRYWTNTYVTGRLLVGKALFRFYPDIGRLR